jgi:hypothetical protein
MASNEHMGPVTAIQSGEQRIEYLPMDYTAVYASIAPLVSEALALLQSGQPKEAEQALKEARRIIATASTFMFAFQVTEQKAGE